MSSLFQGSTAFYSKNKKPTSFGDFEKDKKDLGDIVRDDTVKAVEGTDNVPSDMTSSNSDKEDLGDVVRDDTAKSIQIDEDEKVSETAKIHGDHIDAQKIRLVDF